MNFSYRKPFPFMSTTFLMLCCLTSLLSAQEVVDESKWDELFALDRHKTKLIFAITDECTECFSYFKYVDYLYLHKRDDVEVYVVISKRTENTSILGTMKAEFEEYGYKFHYYFMDDGSYENTVFNRNPHTYIIDHKKVASEVYYKSSGKHEKAILRYVKKDAVKTVDEVEELYVNRVQQK